MSSEDVNMPIPLFVWAAAAVGAGYLAYRNREKIAAYFNSPEGQELVASLQKATDGAMKPYKDICDRCLPMHTTERKEFLRELKNNKMSDLSWSMLVGYAKELIKKDMTYFAVSVDINVVNDERA
jgi:hypothetical protein